MNAESRRMPRDCELPWFVAHTRPRCEKRLVEYCEREGVVASLPLYQQVRKYQRKTVSTEKPLFPGYVFLRLHKEQRQTVYQSDYVANLLNVPDQETFEAQLADIFQALETDYQVFLAPEIKTGSRVKIKSGPLRGLEGFVEERTGVVEVYLRLDFIQQAAAVRIDASELELT